MKIDIIPDKPEFYPGETLSGKIKITPDTKTSIKDIEISLYFVEDWNHLRSDNKYETSNNTQCISVFFVGIYLFLNRPKNSICYLEPKEYTFPFEEKLPDFLLPSFEFPQNKFRAFLRYTLTAKTVSSDPSASSTIFINISSIPKKDDFNSLKKSGIFNKGQSTFKVSYLTKNYKLTDKIPIDIEIDNTNSKMKINECKLRLKRKIIFKDKEDFSDKYTQEEKLIKKEFKIVVNKKEKKDFNFELDLKTINYKDFNYDGFTNPYKDKKNYADLIPSFDGNIINCEYTLIVKLKFSSYLPKKETPTIIMPIYIVHKLDNDHIEKAKREVERLKKNEEKKMDEKIINEFEVLSLDNNANNKKEGININNDNNINNNNNINIDNKKGYMPENQYDKINLDFKKDNNYLYNQNNQNAQNNQNIQFNKNNEEEDEFDLPTRESLAKEYENKEKDKKKQNEDNNKINNFNYNKKNNNDDNDDDNDELDDIIDINEYDEDIKDLPNLDNNNLNKKENEIKNNNNNIKINVENNFNKKNENNNLKNDLNYNNNDNNIFDYPSFDEINNNIHLNNQINPNQNNNNF